jgi:hypothetical protein
MVIVSRQPNNPLSETGLSGLVCMPMRRGVVAQRSWQGASLRKEYTGLFIAMPAIPGTEYQDKNHEKNRSGGRWGPRT